MPRVLHLSLVALSQGRTFEALQVSLSLQLARDALNAFSEASLAFSSTRLRPLGLSSQSGRAI